MDRKGQLNVIGAVMAVIIAVVGIVVGIIIVEELGAVVNTQMEINSTGQSTCNASALNPAMSGYCPNFQGSWNTTKDMSTAGFQILPIIIIIIAATAVIGAVLVLGGRG